MEEDSDMQLLEKIMRNRKKLTEELKKDFAVKEPKIEETKPPKKQLSKDNEE